LHLSGSCNGQRVDRHLSKFTLQDQPESIGQKILKHSLKSRRIALRKVLLFIAGSARGKKRLDFVVVARPSPCGPAFDKRAILTVRDYDEGQDRDSGKCQSGRMEASP